MLIQHDLDPARAVLDELRDAALELDNLFFRAWYQTGNGFIALFRGDLETARREFERAIGDCRTVGDPSTGSIAVSWLAECETLGGEHAAAARRLSSLTQSGPDADEFGADEPTVIAAATLALGLGDADGALEVLEKLPVDDSGLAVPVWAAWSQMLRGAAFLALGDAAAADAALQDARRWAAPPLANPWIASGVDYQLGVLARLRGQTRDAERLHHDALAVRHEHGFLPGIVDSLEALAVLAADGESYREGVRLLAACSVVRTAHGLPRRPTDVDAYEACLVLVGERLGDELASAWAEGEALTVDEAVAYAARARSERKRPSSGWDALTPMEHQVVALAAEGLTNPQIAERLFVARGTVKIHLSHIFSKLGVATRSELASAATRRSAEDG